MPTYTSMMNPFMQMQQAVCATNAQTACPAISSTFTSMTSFTLPSLYSTTGTAGGSHFTTADAIANTFVNGFIEIDEEDYVNHAEYYELARQRGIQFRIRTAEETRLRAEAAERARVAAEHARRERDAVIARARELLLSHLTAEQRETVEKNKWFVVVGGRTKTEYRIRTDYGIAGNIEVLSKGKKVATLCCHCNHAIPNNDQFLAQKIALQYDEDNFLKIANRRAA